MEQAPSFSGNHERSESRLIKVHLGDIRNPGSCWVSYRKHPSFVHVYHDLETQLGNHFLKEENSRSDEWTPREDKFVAIRTAYNT